MKKQLLALLIIGLSLGQLFAQQLDLVYPMENQMDYKSLEYLKNNNGEFEVNILHQPPTNGNTIKDLHYNVYVKLFYETAEPINDDQSMLLESDDPAVLQEVTLSNCNLTFTGEEMASGGLLPQVSNLSTSLSINAMTDMAVKVFHLNEDESEDLDFTKLTKVKLAIPTTEFSNIPQGIRENLYLQVYVEYARYEIGSGLYETDYISNNINLRENEVLVHWDNQNNMNGVNYELEWVHMPPAYNTSNGHYKVDWSNAVRVQTQEPKYLLHVNYEDGFIVSRVRTIRHQINAAQTDLIDKIEYGEWSIPESEETVITNHAQYVRNVLDINNPNNSASMIFNGYSNTNWQYTANYANMGKKKESLNFFDGSNRNRQSLVYVSEDGERANPQDGIPLEEVKLIAQENYYDYNGQPVVNLLPTPLIGYNGIKYQNNLNPLLGNKMSKAEVDHISNGILPVALDASSTATGAAQYYSSENKELAANPNGKAAFIPDAEGYPYSRTVLMNDGSGRPKATYGPGEELATDADGSKNTRYFYSKPTQSELDALFGTNIGLAEYYKKNITIDGNGVISMAYIDQKDRTVATSIAGQANPASNMQEVSGSPRNFTEELFANSPAYFDRNELSYSLQHPFFVAQGGDYKFNYTLDKNNLINCSAASNELCYECNYDFSFQLLDEDGELIVQVEMAEVSSNTDCSQAKQYKFSDITFPNPIPDPNALELDPITGELKIFLNSGKNFTLIQKLSLQTDQLDAYMASNRQDANCNRETLEDFIQAELNNSEFEDCRSEFEDPCSDIRDQLRKDFEYPDGAFVSGVTENEDLLELILKRVRRQENCSGAAPYPNFTEPSSAIQYEVASYIASTKTQFKTQFGFSLTQTFTIADYKEEHYDFFIEHHPSYCKLKACETFNSTESQQFDKILESSTSYIDFVNTAKVEIDHIAIMANDPNSPTPELELNNALTELKVKNNSIVNEMDGWFVDAIMKNKYTSLFSNVQPQNLPSSIGSMEFNNDAALIAFDKGLMNYIYNNNPSGSYPTMGLFEHQQFPASLVCYFENTSGLQWGAGSESSRADYFYLTLGYFADYLGCSNYDNLGITEMARLTVEGRSDYASLSQVQINEYFWESYKNLYASAKRNLIHDFINYSSCAIKDAGNFYYTNPNAGLPTDGNPWYWDRIYSWGEWWTNASDCDIWLGETPTDREYTQISDANAYKDDQIDVDNINAQIKQDLLDLMTATWSSCGADQFEALAGAQYDYIALLNSANPFAQINTLMNNYSCSPLYSNKTYNCDAYLLNLSSILTPYYQHFVDHSTGNPYFTKALENPARVNCSDFNQKINAYTTATTFALPICDTYAEINIKDIDQIRFTNWMNYELGLNAAFTDYFDFSYSCVDYVSRPAFHAINTWTAPPFFIATKYSDIFDAVLNIGNIPGNYLTDYRTQPTLLTSTINGLISNSAHKINTTHDYIGFGTVDYADSHNDLFYLEYQRSNFADINTNFNTIFNALRPELRANNHEKYKDFEEAYYAYARTIENIPNTSYMLRQNGQDQTVSIERAVLHSNGTLWVRLLDDNGDFYDNYYYHYKPHHVDDDGNAYRLSDLSKSTFAGFTEAEPIFHDEAIQYVALAHAEGEALLASSDKVMATASRMITSEMNSIQGTAALPLLKGCEDIKRDNAVINGAVKFKEYLEEIDRNFKQDYLSFCSNRSGLNEYEVAGFTQSLEMQYTSNERHFTLYYYDQADNLVATVPPEGIGNSFKSVSPSQVINDLQFENVRQSIKDYRSSHTNPMILPEHKLQTTYTYNAANQIIQQQTPNGGITHFWYDSDGRLVLSQNQKQKEASLFSYTLYDHLSRIKESGEVSLADLNGQNWEHISNKVIYGEDLIPEFVLADKIVANDRKDVMKTYYDNKVLSDMNTPADFSQDNLRSRVVTQAYYNTRIGGAIKIPGASNPIVQLSLDGHAKDQSGNGNNGILNGPIPSADQDSKPSKALSFNGSDNYISIPNHNALNSGEITVAAWIKGNSSGSGGTIIGKSDNMNYAWQMYVNPTNGNRLEVIVSPDGHYNNNSSKIYSSVYSILDDQWHHIAFTFSYNSGLEIYIDGTLHDHHIISDAQILGGIFPTTNDIAIGGAFNQTTDSYDDFFKGEMNDIVIFDEAFTASQLAALYNYKHPNTQENWQYATHYSYDPTGNVKVLLNDYYQNGKITNENNRFKRLDYAFDPISGNVLRLYYQLGKEDAFYHRYEYDAENRITKAETSMDGIIWDTDAKYQYYLHGPLARTVIGDHKVQGIDYAYTLQGWLKAVNSGVHGSDMGNDQVKANNVFGEDAFGFALQYYQGDYEAIGGNTNFVLNHPSAELANLYNGNIAAKSMHQQDLSIGKVYAYDQLNRIKGMNEYLINQAETAPSTWGHMNTESGYSSAYEYDGNGNLKGLQRIDGKFLEVNPTTDGMIDNMEYHYKSGTDQLTAVTDHSSFTSINDFKSQFSDNYDYDEIGNLIKDEQAGVADIEWYPNGKIKRVRRSNASASRPELFFEYDALGNRVKKEVSFTEAGRFYTQTTMYSRDAQGNTLTTYTEKNDCLQADGENSDYFQYTHDYQYYTEETVGSTGGSPDALLNYLNNDFGRKTELCQTAADNLHNIQNARNLIFNYLDVAAYVNLNVDAEKRVFNHYPYTYANDLYTNQQTDFISIANVDNEARIQSLKTYNLIGDFYTQFGVLYASNLTAGQQMAYVQDIWNMNRTVVNDLIANNQTLLQNILTLTTAQSQTVINAHSSPQAHFSNLQTLFSNLENNLNNSDPDFQDNIREINALLLAMTIDPAQLPSLLNGITLNTFYTALNSLPSPHQEKLNSILHHLHLIYEANAVGSSPINTGSLLTYQPMAVMNWSQDANGTYLEQYLHQQVANTNVRTLAENYFTPTYNMVNTDIYFSSGSAVRPYVVAAINNHDFDSNPILKASLLSAGNLQSTELALHATEGIAPLAHYLKTSQPDKAIFINYQTDALQAALSAVLNYSPIDYAEDLNQKFDQDLNFALPGSECDNISLEAQSFDIYGSSRLGVMDAKEKRQSESDASYFSRTLGAKTYELTDHLGNVVATISDKKLHPQETVVNGNQNIDPTIGFQADVINRFDRYPFGQEMQRTASKCFTVADLKQASDNHGAFTTKTALTDFLNNALGLEKTYEEYRVVLEKNNLLSHYISFNGNHHGRYVDFGTEPQYDLGTNDFTIEAWIKPEIPDASTYPIVSNQEHVPGGNGYLTKGIILAVHNNKIIFGCSDGTGIKVIETPAPANNNWHHIVAQRVSNANGNADDYKIFINGVDANATVAQNSSGTNDNINSAESLKIGSRQGSFDNRSFRGGIREVRLYKRVISTTEISENYYSQISVSNTNDLLLWAPLNQGIDIFTDKSSYQNTGSRLGTLTFAGDFNNSSQFLQEENMAFCSYLIDENDLAASEEYSVVSLDQTTYELLYDGLMDNCPASSWVQNKTFSLNGGATVNETGRLECTQLPNLYGQQYVDHIEIGVEGLPGNFKRVNASMGVEFTIPIKEEVGDLDPETTYIMELYFSNMKKRGDGGATVYNDDNTVHPWQSVNNPIDAAPAVNVEDNEKKIVLKYKGLEWNNFLAHNGNDALEILVNAYLAYPWETQDYHETILFESLKFYKVVEDDQVQLAKRTEKSYPYGFQGQEIDKEWEGARFNGAPIAQWAEPINNVLLVDEDFANLDFWNEGSCATTDGTDLILSNLNSNCEVISEIFYGEPHKKYQLQYNAENMGNHTAHIQWQYFNNSTGQWVNHATLTIANGNSAYGENLLDLDQWSTTGQMRVNIYYSNINSGSTTPAKIHDLKILEYMPGNWSFQHAAGDYSRVLDGKLELRRENNLNFAKTDIILKAEKVGALHTLTLNAEWIDNANGNGKPYIAVKESNGNGGTVELERLYLPNSMYNTGIQPLIIEFTPTQSSITLELNSYEEANTTNANPTIVRYDNFELHDGTTTLSLGESIGNKLAFKYRVHDAALGRFLSVDPLASEYPWNSPYAFSENRVIDGIDLEGAEFMSKEHAMMALKNGRGKKKTTAEQIESYQYNPNCPQCNVNNPYVLHSMQTGKGGYVDEQVVREVDGDFGATLTFFIPIPFSGAIGNGVGRAFKWAGGKLIASPAARQAAEIFAKQYGVTRGVALEGLAALNKYKGWNWAGNIANNFPTFDFYKNGVFSSFKSWNAQAFNLNSYKGFINKIANKVETGSFKFKGETYEVKQGVLDILVPEGQLKEFTTQGGKYFDDFQKLIDYGKTNNVKVNIGSKIDG